MDIKSKTTTISFRCPGDMLDAIDSIGKQYYPKDKNSKTGSECDRTKALFHILKAGIAALTDGNAQIEVRQPTIESKTDSKTLIDQQELEDLVKKMIADNQVIQTSNTIDDCVRHCEELVKTSITDGDIGEAIANSYTAMMGQFNGLLGELQELKKQLTTDNGEPTTDKQRKIIDFFADVDIYSPVGADVIKSSGVGEKIKKNKEELKQILGKEIDTKSSLIVRVKNILKSAGFDVGGNPGQGYFVKS